MKTMRSSLIICFALAIFLLLVYFPKDTFCARQENYCFTCHTSARKLIQITRQISKTHKARPGASPETKGEG
ncbi:MAG: hypothetical protein DRG63_06940 [Deltaproteobacteria bacterium]|nr:MAG: hypothetical protein DRG63_06940 [Deltaproteobacteria bacterium]RLB21072.1 MAG: hypothetical protein DRG76_09760 [Deltaproteobacteria bacterium]